jgi:hypothetical protein
VSGSIFAGKFASLGAQGASEESVKKYFKGR